MGYTNQAENTLISLKIFNEIYFLKKCYLFFYKRRGFVWLAFLTYISWKRLRRGLSSWTKTESSFPKSAQTIQMMQENNHFSGVNWSLLKTRPDLLKIESANVHFHANPYISPNAQSKHICIFTEFPMVP